MPELIWNDFTWDIVREVKEEWKNIEDQIVIYGKTGSIWGTREFRLEVFHSDEPDVTNIFLLYAATSLGLNGFTLDVKCFPTIHGAQAGIVYYQDDLNYIKLVLEGDKTGGTMMILAIEEAGEAIVLHKVSEYRNNGEDFHSLQLCLVPCDGEGTRIEIAGPGFHEFIHSDKVVRDGRFGFMAHSLEKSEEERYRWAAFRNPRLE